MSESDEMIVGIEMKVVDKFELTVSWARSLTLNTKPSPHQYFLRWMRNSRLELPVFTCSVSTELVVNGKLTYFPFWHCLTVMAEVLGHGQMCMELFHSSRFKWFCSWENGTDIKVTKHFVQITPSTFGRKCTFILHHWYRLQTKVTVHHIPSHLNLMNLILSKSSSPHVHDSIH